jgi:hypothetical protein
VTAPAALPCALCGLPVVDLGAIRWDRAPTSPDYITALRPICAQCVADPQTKELLDANRQEVTH